MRFTPRQGLVRLLLARDLFQVVFFSSMRLLLARDMFRIVLLVQLPFDGVYFGECISRSDCVVGCLKK